MLVGSPVVLIRSTRGIAGAAQPWSESFRRSCALFMPESPQGHVGTKAYQA